MKIYIPFNNAEIQREGERERERERETKKPPDKQNSKNYLDLLKRLKHFHLLKRSVLVLLSLMETSLT